MIPECLKDLCEIMLPDVEWRWQLQQTIKDKRFEIEQLSVALTTANHELRRLKTPPAVTPVEDDARAARVARNAMEGVGKESRGAAASIPLPNVMGTAATRCNAGRAAARAASQAEKVAGIEAIGPAQTNSEIVADIEGGE